MPRGEGGNAEAQPEDHGGQAEGEHVLPPIAGNHENIDHAHNGAEHQQVDLIKANVHLPLPEQKPDQEKIENQPDGVERRKRFLLPGV